jgi:hypothetical protein
MILASFGNSFFVARALAGVPSSKSRRTQAKAFATSSVPCFGGFFGFSEIEIPLFSSTIWVRLGKITLLAVVPNDCGAQKGAATSC